VKLNDYSDRHYNADRVLYPLKRNGPKGSRAFVRISWDQALAEINSVGTKILQTTAQKPLWRSVISAMKVSYRA